MQISQRTLSLSFLDCGCKGKDFFLTSKFFGEKFSSFFSQADLRAVGNYRLAQPTSSPTQGYLHVSIISEAPFSLECGCKSNAIKHNLQTFSALFFKFFLMAQQSLRLMYAHDKGTYIYLYWCWQYLDGHGNRFQVSRFHEPLFLTHAQVHIIQFLLIAPSASGKNIMSWLRKFFEAIHPA